MSFSVKLSDMERQITSFERKIQRQAAEIDQLSAKLDSKAERSQFQNLETLLNSKMVNLNDEINTKDLVVERYRNKLRQLEAEVTVSGLVYDVPSQPSLVTVLCTPGGWGGGYSKTSTVVLATTSFKTYQTSKNTARKESRISFYTIIFTETGTGTVTVYFPISVQFKFSKVAVFC